MAIYGNTVGGTGSTAKTFLLVDEQGNEAVGVVVDEETIFDATANDVREGKTVATGDGVTVGTKVIPSYHTTETVSVILPNSTFVVPLPVLDLYDYTKVQAIICPLNTSLSDSVSAEKVAIGGGVYAVGSTEQISAVSKDAETKSINFGIINNSNTVYLIRCFTYKEIF